MNKNQVYKLIYYFLVGISIAAFMLASAKFFQVTHMTQEDVKRYRQLCVIHNDCPEWMERELQRK